MAAATTEMMTETDKEEMVEIAEMEGMIGLILRERIESLKDLRLKESRIRFS